MSCTFDFFVGTAGYDRAVQSVSTAVDISARYPMRPFRERTGTVSIVEFSRCLSGDFGAVLAQLARCFDDTSVTMVALEPDPSIYLSSFTTAPAFRVDVQDLPAGFGDALVWEPSGPINGALLYTLDCFTIVGSSGRWAVWAQRDWDIAAILTPFPDGPWRDTGIPFYGPSLDLASIRQPAGWGLPLSAEEINQFWLNMS